MPRKTNGARGSDALHRELPQPPSQPQSTFQPLSSTTLPPSRAGTLSWQQRPSSRGSTGSSSRPLSLAASENKASKSPAPIATDAPTKDESMSRNQISQSLGSKDPAWFKQTSDRGFGSAAFRRTRDNLSDTATIKGGGRLPGMSRESTVESEDQTKSSPDTIRSASPSREGSIRGVSGLGHKHSASGPLASSGVIRFPLSTTGSQKLDPPSTLNPSTGEKSSIARTLAMSPSQGRLSPEHLDRPASPTKGLGGFVQSAMLKRSDSVNKRWSAQVAPGLSRGNSIASNSGGYDGARYPMGGITPLKDSRPSSMNREGSTERSSRPGSSHSTTTLPRPPIEDEGTDVSTHLASLNPVSTPNEILEPAPIDSKPFQPSEQDDNEAVMSPPASPSKKWSPTKASWLENAINKPDSSRVKSPAPQQPAWMAEINRAKQQRGSNEISKRGYFKEVSTGGLIRSPPPGTGYKPPGVGGFSGGFSTGVVAKPRAGNLERGSQQIETQKLMNDNDRSRESSLPHTPPAKGSATKASPSWKPPFEEKPTNSPSANTYSSRLDSHNPSSSGARPKPETPQKFDLKSTLKSKQPSAESTSKDEPEFKNVFGNLKRTQTQNYKAPDELRNNILRGKAGLAVTGGPKRTERKDEFMESILKKKAGMMVPSASTRITSASSRLREDSVPEAIAKRQGLSRSASVLSNDGTEEAGKPSGAEALAKSQSLQDKSKPIPPEKPLRVRSNGEEDLAPKGLLGGGFTSSLAGMLGRGPSPMTSNDKPDIPSASGDGQDMQPTARPSNEDAISIGSQLTHATKARARGPKRRLPTTSTQHAAKNVPLPQPEPPLAIAVAESRTLYPTDVTKSQNVPPSFHRPESRPLSNITHNNNNNRRASQPSSPRKPSTSIAQPSNLKTSSPISQVHGTEFQNKPTAVVKGKPALSPKDRKPPKSFSPAHGPSPDTPLKELAAQESHDVDAELNISHERREPEPREVDRPTPSVKGEAAPWGRASMQPTQHQAPVPIDARKDEEAAKEEAGFRSKPPAVAPIGLGIETTVRGTKSSFEHKPPLPGTPSPKSPPLPGRKPASIANRIVSTPPSSPAVIALPTSATSQAFRPSQNTSSGASDLFANVFDECPSPKTNVDIDTQAVLNSCSSKDSSLKIKTLRKQIFEIIENGKSIPVPSHQEHILFEGSLYICNHVFGTLAGTRTTEVYLWCGDAVPSSFIEDSVLFAKKVAKDNNGKFIILKQGKETSNFFQALGGIVITRRGPRSHLETSVGTTGTYLLCGRQHVGQIAFDEVDCSPGSLCKGFPYILATGSGSLYLWKGNGSGADELGCARLIGMDLGLTGEIEEIDDGQEPDVFWQSFPGESRHVHTAEGTSSGYWHLKPSCEKYTTRLYGINVDVPRPKSSSGFMQWGRRGSAPAETNAAATAQISEITPFAQLDLMDDGVFVLDAFFEIFV